MVVSTVVIVIVLVIAMSLRHHCTKQRAFKFKHSLPHKPTLPTPVRMVMALLLIYFGHWGKLSSLGSI